MMMATLSYRLHPKDRPDDWDDLVLSEDWPALRSKVEEGDRYSIAVASVGTMAVSKVPIIIVAIPLSPGVRADDVSIWVRQAWVEIAGDSAESIPYVVKGRTKVAGVFDAMTAHGPIVFNRLADD